VKQIAFRRGFIDAEQLGALAARLKGTACPLPAAHGARGGKTHFAYKGTKSDSMAGRSLEARQGRLAPCFKIRIHKMSNNS
jgi:hypothetical protein